MGKHAMYEGHLRLSALFPLPLLLVVSSCRGVTESVHLFHFPRWHFFSFFSLHPSLSASLPLFPSSSLSLSLFLGIIDRLIFASLVIHLEQ